MELAASQLPNVLKKIFNKIKKTVCGKSFFDLVDVNLILFIIYKDDKIIVLFLFLTSPVKFLNFNKNLDTSL